MNRGWRKSGKEFLKYAFTYQRLSILLNTEGSNTIWVTFLDGKI